MSSNSEAATGNERGFAPSRVLSSAASGVIDKIQNCGGDPDSILGRANINTRDLDGPANELYLTHFCRLFEEAAEQTGNDNFGLQFGDAFKPNQLGAIGYAAMSSPTLSAALRNMEVYFPAHQSKTSFGLLQDSDIIWLSYKILDEHIENRRQDAELSIGIFCNIFRHCLGDDWAPLEIRFEHAIPDHPSEHEKRFNAPVRFGRRTNAIAFRRSDLDARMPTQDPYLFSVIEPFLKSRCELLIDPVGFAEMVRNHIMLNLGDAPPTMSEIADILGLSGASFQKRLREYGLTYQDLLNAARQELAVHYLKDPEIQVTEVAYRLGYSELSAFSRAFRAWAGMSPQRYRRNIIRSS
ncbi:MAG: AraC family transcriptional regulator [Rhodospirillales bacterium]|jgi:AraC-like DNA-binding protein|nr:AraC family transcriptional regulator [Rhodospirillales bacterium]